MIKDITVDSTKQQAGLSEKTLAMIQPHLQVNQNHAHIFQAKIVRFLLDEVDANRLVIQAAVQQNQGGEIAKKLMQFKQLESDDDDDDVDDEVYEDDKDWVKGIMIGIDENILERTALPFLIDDLVRQV